MPDQVRDVLDKAAEGFVSFGQMADRLGVAMAGSETPNVFEIEALRAAMLYHLGPGGTFAGWYQGATPERWPGDITQMPADTLEVWATYAQVAEHPGVRAHLHDLLAAADHGQRHVHIRAAIADYQEAAPWFAAAHEVVPGRWRAGECLTRAFHLAVSTGQKDLLNGVVADMLVMAEESLDGPDPAPGLVGLLIDPLLERKALKQSARPVVEKAVETFKDNVHVQVDFLADLRALEADDSARQTIDRQRVEALLRAAGAEDGLNKLLLLSDAATLARDSGLTDLYDEVRREQQKLTAQDLKLETVTTTVNLPTDVFDACEQHVAQAADLADALWRIASWAAPIGDDEPTADTEQETELKTGFLRLPTNKLNLAGPVLAHLNAVEKNPDDDLRVVRMELTGLLVAHQLDYVWRRFDPSDAEIARVFACEGVASLSKMRELASAFRSYWYREPKAAKVALPLVEGLLRRHLKSVEVPVIRPASGDKAGVVDQLGTLIDKMTEGGFDAGWQTTFRLLLADPKEGLNLRNIELHDLRDEPLHHHHVALVLLAALVILRAAQGRGH
ncbi:hypothetical protein [Streptomyces acidiscabies]|uniref:DUF4209 domain-containing protein n=1 Tax=Streptomyces acidiscabies TaxID=42234 RepID=A0A0L0KKH8_9ACTN|nr:hypothetical protein [Streptomyces acidiscabies]KND38343.1 hypothetical protein IQ63_08280 [Streptomyces acidiscabies]